MLEASPEERGNRNLMKPIKMKHTTAHVTIFFEGNGCNSNGQKSIINEKRLQNNPKRKDENDGVWVACTENNQPTKIKKKVCALCGIHKFV